MGIKSASKIISSCKNLTVKDIKDALNAVIQQQHNVDENEPSAPSPSETVPNQQLVIDVDCNWVACYLGDTKTQRMHLQQQLTFLKCFQIMDS